MVGILMGQENPLDTLWINKVEGIVEPCTLVTARSCVDEHGLIPVDDGGVDKYRQWLAKGMLDLMNHIGARCDLGWVLVVGGLGQDG